MPAACCQQSISPPIGLAWLGAGCSAAWRY
jgi:hypothetical protein